MRSRHNWARLPSLLGLVVLLATPAVVRAQPTGEQERTAPVLINQNEVSLKLNDAIRDQVQGLDLKADGEVKIVVDENGMPVRHWLTRETGYEALDRAIGEVVATMRFKPASEAGQPVPCVATIPIAFRPDGADVSA